MTQGLCALCPACAAGADLRTPQRPSPRQLNDTVALALYSTLTVWKGVGHEKQKKCLCDVCPSCGGLGEQPRS